MTEPGKLMIAEQLYKRASEAIKTSNFDYAVENYLKCAKLVPEKLVYRQALRAAEYKMYKDNRKGASMASTRMMGARSKATYSKTRKKWLDLLEACEDALFLNPWDFSSLYDLAYGLLELEYFDSALWVTTTAIDANKENAEVWRLFAKALEKTNNFAKASQAWEMVHKLDPKDSEATSKAHALAASATIQKGGYEDTETGKKIIQNNQTNETISATAVVTDSLESRAQREVTALQKRIDADPKNGGLYIQMGDALRRNEAYSKAVEAYKKAIELSPGGNADAQTRMYEAMIEPLTLSVAEIKDQFKSLDQSKSENVPKLKALQTKYKETASELIKTEVELYRFRVSQKPEDTEAHLELGKRFFQLNQLDDAIKSLQLARQDLRRKAESLCLLGQCFWKKKNYALAQRNLQDALAATDSSDEKTRKEILYFEGCIAQEKNEIQVAIDKFNEIAAMDYGYRDVAKRLDKLNAPTT